ncbi:hypothetical protein SAY86_025419 [Trapa natans]|uniref:RecA family profile 2 domain-containing protein n=1 Tax=Trapa natans TaxID=22666 RepID=A0AAN7M896_TRANT|nr:hypothetical protein SAY86_025419 [Trapa natans]
MIGAPSMLVLFVEVEEPIEFAFHARIGFVKRGEETVGNEVQVKIVKNKLAPPFRTASFELEFGKVIAVGLKHKLVSRAAAMYSLNGPSFRGKNSMKHYLDNNVEVREDLLSNLRERILHEEAETSEGYGASEEMISTNEEVLAAAEA